MRGPRRFSALVVGGGPAGAATALGLARRGLAAVLVESSRYDTFRVGESLPPVARVLLERLGVWERFAAQGHVPSQAILSAWGSEALSEQHSLFSPLGTGWHVERRGFDAMLTSAAEEQGVSVHRASRVASLVGTGPFQARIEGASGSALVEAEFVVDATGRASSVAKSLGSERVAHDRLVGIVGAFEVPGGTPPPASVLLLEAVPEGWWYSVPLPGGSLLVAAMVDADDITRSGLRPQAYHERSLGQTQHTKARASGLTAPGPLIVRKASTERLTRIVGPAFIAVGDAATSFDPLSSQGIWKALASGERAAQAIAERLGGVVDALVSYERHVLDEFWRFQEGRLSNYATEQRWPDTLFWRRRRPLDPQDRALTLDPRAVLRASDGALSERSVADLEGTLPLGEVERLCGLCGESAPAHEIVSRFQGTGRARSPDAEVIRVLQGLLRRGAIALGAPTPR